MYLWQYLWGKEVIAMLFVYASDQLYNSPGNNTEVRNKNMFAKIQRQGWVGKSKAQTTTSF